MRRENNKVNKMKTLPIRKSLEALLIASLFAGSLQACALTGIVGTPSSNGSPGATQEPDGSSVKTAITASFDDIYAGTYTGKYVMYQGIVVNCDYSIRSSYTYLSLVFQDETDSRLIYAHCGSSITGVDASYCYYDGEVSAVDPIIQFDMQNKTPIQVYGLLHGPSDIHIKSISILRGPEDWDSFKLDP